MGFPYEIGARNLGFRFVGVEKGPDSFREILKQVNPACDPVYVSEDLSAKEELGVRVMDCGNVEVDQGKAGTEQGHEELAAASLKL